MEKELREAGWASSQIERWAADRNIIKNAEVRALCVTYARRGLLCVYAGCPILGQFQCFSTVPQQLNCNITTRLKLLKKSNKTRRNPKKASKMT